MKTRFLIPLFIAPALLIAPPLLSSCGATLKWEKPLQGTISLTLPQDGTVSGTLANDKYYVLVVTTTDGLKPTKDESNVGSFGIGSLDYATNGHDKGKSSTVSSTNLSLRGEIYPLPGIVSVLVVWAVYQKKPFYVRMDTGKIDYSHSKFSRIEMPVTVTE